MLTNQAREGLLSGGLRALGRVFYACLGFGVSLGCGLEEAAPPLGPTPNNWMEFEGGEPIGPLPSSAPFDADLAQLGQALFSSKILSEDSQMSCASCHEPVFGMADGRSLPLAPFRPATQTNATTIYNVRYFAKLGWTGKFSDLAQHLDGLIHSPKLMGSNWVQLVARLSAHPEWVRRFSAQFPDGVTATNASAALVEYERSLVTPDAPFDRWLRGDTRALSAEAEQGYELFKRYGCVSCHQGIAIGANLFQRLGVMRDYLADRPFSEPDLGRYNVTQREEDRYVFRVPSLRNVALTPPYLHDGSLGTLPEVVRVMADAQLGIQLSQHETALIISFLGSLTGVPRELPL